MASRSAGPVVRLLPPAVSLYSVREASPIRTRASGVNSSVIISISSFPQRCLKLLAQGSKPIVESIWRRYSARSSVTSPVDQAGMRHGGVGLSPSSCLDVLSEPTRLQKLANATQQ